MSLWQRLRQPRTRRWLRVAVVLVAGLGLLAWAAWGQGRGGLVVENRSGEPIARLTVTFAGETRTFRDVAPGKGFVAPRGPDEGSHFAVDGRLASGAIIHGGGQVLEGADLVVLPRGSIIFRKAGR